MTIKTLFVAVIGAGPAGMSAALWLKNLGLTPIIIEKESEAGGMLNFNFLQNDWVLGQENATGVSISHAYYQHILNEHIELRLQTNITAITRHADTFCLRLSSGSDDVIDNIYCRAIIFATGTRYVGREILAHCQGFGSVDQSKLIEGPYAFLEVDRLCKKSVLIVGAGDNAFENALMLLDKGCHVFMASRSLPRAQAKFLDAVMGHVDFTLLSYAEVESFSQSEEQLQIKVVDVEGAACLLRIDFVHILAGYKATADAIVDMLDSSLGELTVDKQKFMVVDGLGRTNIPYIYAAGDICNRQFPCVVSAVASGALAAKTISQDFLSAIQGG
jgi:thioredoxin reductase (NADPH)